MPTSIRWAGPTALTAEEARVAQALHRIGKFHVFLREIRAALCDDAFQAELAAIYQPRGTKPVPPALLAMVVLLQAYDQIGDAEAIVTAQLDPRADGVGLSRHEHEAGAVFARRVGHVPRADDRP